MSSLADRPFFHEGMREFQDEFDGRRVAEAIERHRKHYSFWDDEREWIEGAQFFFIASAFGEYVDCSIKSGDPGFVKIVGENVIEYPEYDGNSMYRTLGNIRKNPNVGLLFVRFDGKSRRIRINGRASVHAEPEYLARHYGAKFVVRIECELYPNCPRYIPDIAGNAASPHVPREQAGLPPAPEWKRRDYIRNILPANDPHRDEVWTRDSGES
ncbi:MULTISPECIES: pyridoxamine 5'-phosphate oxidase family protein [Bradyrhizobium]|uniref:pyridoxamine 5'-phosphate oxidase family protein n=1 Tax=Bradyrhizobium TaxID=374 RepID=UPI00293EADC1|nr:pyridoxamine 5'-phosphate oxidase family protein [Bradyrhizobium sp. NDS-1]WOH76334.1 pyridoxamine 5'-phosphate oxidase family protein [Bradyrhizobium sp. NDS-1]